jgi:tRNA U38,U39,U40 pseudouridine synthase TruA
MTATLCFVLLSLLSLDSCFLVRPFSAPSSFTNAILLPSSSRTNTRHRQVRALRRILQGIETKQKRRVFFSKSTGIHDEEGVRIADSTSDVLLETPPFAPAPPLGVESARKVHSAGQHTCNRCRKSFPTRNALFRHLRGLDGDDSDGRGMYGQPSTRSRCCGPLAGMADAENQVAVARVPFRVAVQFGYRPKSPRSLSNKSAAEMAASSIRQLLLTPPDSEGDDMYSAAAQITDTNRPHIQSLTRSMNVTLVSITQTTDAKLRASCLRQEVECSAASDVLVVSGDVALAIATGEPLSLEILPSKMELQSLVEQDIAGRILRGQAPASNLRVEAIKFLERPLHAERSCTQYVYHYLLPSSWLVDPENEIPRWMEKEHVLTSRPNNFSPYRGAETKERERQRRPPALVRLKQALRSMESPRLDAPPTSLMKDDGNSDSDCRTRQRQRVAAGRFGGLAFKTRQAFHNYCDQQLMGAISPNHDVVWRCVDRARIVDFVVSSDEKKAGDGNFDAAVVLEFRGDAFLTHQIRTMVGTALSIANGWLSSDTTVPISVSPDHIVAPFPCAPSGRLYLAEPRFHFEELRNSGKPLFDPGADSKVLLASQYRHESHRSLSNIQWIQRELLSRKERLDEQMVEAEWLRGAELIVCPAARIALAASVDESGSTKLATHEARSGAPKAFNNVLTQLRSVVAAGSWPETTAARSYVIRGELDEERNGICMGSFTVVNPALVKKDSHHLGNDMFPELVNGVFALEQVLSDQERDLVTTSMANGTIHPTTLSTSSHRHPSTHCAINCNAQFTPHVDSGRGLGQTMSMIVGLGDYSGGELMVEGSQHDIRYKAAEFDGWKLRHWTRPFLGERFSLVWFTPALGFGKDLESTTGDE